jgi:hypothetical protein
MSASGSEAIVTVKSGAQKKTRSAHERQYARRQSRARTSDAAGTVLVIDVRKVHSKRSEKTKQYQVRSLNSLISVPRRNRPPQRSTEVSTSFR